ncbi:MAG: spinster family MFS transporter [Saprospiraceae bacterium]
MPNTQEIKPIYSESYKKYVLYVLTGVYIFNFIDRQILVILQESIKADLGLSDTQLGLLTGLAFALFYVTLGIPIARLADKTNRKKIIAVSLAIWSAMTVVSGRAMNFTQLLLARVGVGIGEAGASPAAHSMISDYFPANKRATALAVYSMGIYIGILLGYLFGGWLDEFFGWRTALMVLGLPGILYAVFFYFTVKEPPRGYADNLSTSDAANYSLGQVFGLLMSRKAFLCLALGAGIHCFSVYGVGNWLPSFLARLHGMERGEIGTWLAIGSGGGGALGVWLGGYLTDKYGKEDRRMYLIIPTLAIVVSIPLLAIMLTTANKYVVVGGNIVVKTLWSFYLAPCIAMAHGMVGLRMRALASAVFYLFLNLIGLGLGPLFIGMASDYLTPEYGQEGLRFALMMGIGMSMIAAFLFWRASTYLEKDLDAAPK